MMQTLRPLLLVWLALLALLGVELGGAFLRLGHLFGGLLLLPAGAMVALVGLFFMRLRHASGLSRGFALAAMFWLVVLLGLGSMDPMTRTLHPVAMTTYP
ncbi:MAG: hypothetical protein JO264_11925 [Acidisphaera sp.]|nr:hypothetical protein [Acidisphaera sp.]